MAESQEGTRPSAQLTPSDVVRLALAAFERSPDHAARFLWEFGSEKLRRNAGDETHLERLLGNELFGPLVDFERVRLGPLERIEDSARQMISVDGGRTGTARFLLSLKRSGYGERRGCWLISGLEREW